MNWQDDMLVALLRKAYARDLDALTIRQDKALRNYVREVFAAGRTEGEKLGRAWRPAAIASRVELGRTRIVDLGIELLASVSTLAAMRLGSTTLYGSELYIVSSLAWCAISWRNGLHGIWPLNIGALCVAFWNLSGALP